MGPLSELQMGFWMDKAVQWGQATSSSAQEDICKHMQSLGAFLQQLVHALQTTVISSARPLYSREELSDSKRNYQKDTSLNFNA